MAGKKDWNRNSECWWVNQRGYIEGRIIKNGIEKRVKQHRWVYENHHNIKLSNGQDVHHINGVKTDNRIENLELLDHGIHTTVSNQREYKRGYRLKLSDADRKRRSEWMSRLHRIKADGANNEKS
jgi:hypothetical protein